MESLDSKQKSLRVAILFIVFLLAYKRKHFEFECFVRNLVEKNDERKVKKC